MEKIQDKYMTQVLRRCQRVLRMVSELHKLGFQGLRIYPYQGAVGNWRVEIHPSNHFSSDNSLQLETASPSRIEPARHSAGGSGETYFLDWKDSDTDNSRRLAKKFITRFPELCEASKVRDWSYAGWYQELMGCIETDNRLPCLFWEYSESYTQLPIKKMTNHGFDFEFEFPSPPSNRL